MLYDRKDKCLSPNPEFIFDQACLDITNLLNETVTIVGQYVECDKCEFQNLTVLPGKQNASLLINTKYSMRMHYIRDGNGMCDWDQELFEHYRYGWNISDKCSQLYVKEEADNAYIPILSAFIILFFFGTIWYMVKGIYKCTKNNVIWRRCTIWVNTEVENDLGSPYDSAPLVIEQTPTIRKHPNRIKSIDVFRGLCIMMMIFVNYGGGQYWFFKHSVWNGITVADLIFPWFMWLMGLSMSVSIAKKLRTAVPRRELYISVVRRSIVLVALGLVLNSHGLNTPLTSLRFPGVLQRLGVVYLIVGLIEVTFTKRDALDFASGRLAFLGDILPAFPQWICVALITVVHLCVTFLLAGPGVGCEPGYLGPGGLHDLGGHKNCTGGAAGYIDRLVFGEHMYKHPTCQKVYENAVYYDPEGILGSLTSVLLVYFGVQAGRTLNRFTSIKSRVIRWICWGIITALLGGILCNFSKNSGPIPLNKNLFSLSFVFLMAGTAFLLQTALFLLVDITRKWGGRPFFYPGMNPLLLYILHELFRDTFPFAWTPTEKTHAAYLGMNLWGTALWVALSIYLYKQNIFVAL